MILHERRDSFIRSQPALRGKIKDVPAYPGKIHAIPVDPRKSGSVPQASAEGVAASLTCGASIRYYLDIQAAGLVITDVRILSEGCGSAIAAAGALADAMRGRSLADLHGFDTDEVLASLNIEVVDLPTDRRQCGELAVLAFQAALAGYRAARAHEYSGERALICTCFGIGEESIEQAIDVGRLDSVDEVAVTTNAGSGCGSCRMLIQEILDSRVM